MEALFVRQSNSSVHGEKKIKDQNGQTQLGLGDASYTWSKKYVTDFSLIFHDQIDGVTGPTVKGY
jgi:hypothetical protein